tara:strand:+ start:6626 stop:7444 length:819 start_codon:yes stop_codon:yes gene_type:complete
MADEQVAEASAEPAAQPSEEVSWKSSLPEDIRDHSALSPIQDVGNLAKSYINAQSMIGRDKVAIPGQHSSPEDWDNVYDRLGRPESADAYEFDLGENTNDEIMAWYKTAAHDIGLNPSQAQKLAESYNELLAQSAENVPDYDSIRSEREAVLKKEWGGKYEDNINLGSSILKEFSDEPLTEIDLADGSKLGDNPDFVRAMVNVGSFIKERVSEDAFEGIAKGSGGLSPDDINDQLREIENPQGPLFDGSHPQHREYVERRSRLYAQKFPEIE